MTLQCRLVAVSMLTGFLLSATSMARAGGACCAGPGACIVTASEAECISINGRFLGAGTEVLCSVGSSPCDPPSWGACCVVYGCIQRDPLSCAALNGLFLGSDTGCLPEPCPPPTAEVRACCLRSGDCINVPWPFCGDAGGEEQGAGSTCAQAGCPQAQACCLGNGQCLDVTVAFCVSLGGAPQGPLTICVQSNCPPGEACCLGGGQCMDIAVASCVAMGGTPQGPLTICAQANCPFVEACCFNIGQCLDMLIGDCVTSGGMPQGPMSICAQISCPITQACCLSNGQCMDLTTATCVTSGGIPQGPLTICSQMSCPTTQVGTCCIGDGTCVVTTQSQCQGAYMGDNTEALCQPGHAPCPQPPSGACCRSYGCSLVGSVAFCQLPDIYGGDGSTCLPLICPNPPQLTACCLHDQTCLDLEQSFCESLGGSPGAPGVSCSLTVCSPYEACCLADGACAERTPFACINNLGGTPQGPGTTCTPNPCSMSILTIPATANIFGAGHVVAPDPGGGGGGVLPVVYYLAPGVNRVITFSGIGGIVSCCGGGNANGPDGFRGLPSDVVSWNGISGVVHIDSQMFLVGVFLGDSEPADPAPPRLDCSNDSFAVLAPQPGQTFFIGDGRTGAGSGDTQQFLVPENATRLFLGFADAYAFYDLPGWYDDDTGQLTIASITVSESPSVACCAPDGSCIQTAALACTNMGGTPQGPGTTCAAVACTPPQPIRINEIRINEPSHSNNQDLADPDEYFELHGSGNTNLNGYWYIVIGRGSPSVGSAHRNSGVIEEVVDLSGKSIPLSGFFLVTETTYRPLSGEVLNWRRSLRFENGHSVTHMLVRDFAGQVVGDDLDTNDDGVLEIQPWSSVVDCVAIMGPVNPVPALNDRVYCDTPVGPKVGVRKSFVPGHVLRSIDGGGSWLVGSWEFFPPTIGVFPPDTPGATNTPAQGACCIDSKCESKKTSVQCAAMGGRWAGADTECPPPASAEPCPSPCIGACCTAGGSCGEAVGEQSCISAGGWYRGGGTTCAVVSCAYDRNVRINELSSGDPGVDTREFVELFMPATPAGTAHALAGMSLIIVTGSGSQEPTYRHDFKLGETIEENGFFVLGTPACASVSFYEKAGWIENHSQTYALARTQDITLCAGNPDDPNFNPPDGCYGAVNSQRISDVSMDKIASNAIDAVATLDIGGGIAYFDAPVVKSGLFQASYMQRKIDGQDTDTTDDWDIQWNQTAGEVGDTATPCLPNVYVTGSCCTAGGCTIETRSYCENALQGKYNGNGTTCVTNPCTGACCFNSGYFSCSVMSPQNCATAGGGGGGLFMGIGTTCSGNCTRLVPTARSAAINVGVIVRQAIVTSLDDVLAQGGYSVFHLGTTATEAGISVVGPSAVIDSIHAQLQVGNKIHIAGTTRQSNGLFELFDGVRPLRLVLNDHLVTSTSALPVTADVFQMGSAAAETYESRVVRLAGVTFRPDDSSNSQNFFEGGRSYDVTDGTYLVRVNIPFSATTLIGQPIPFGAVHDLQGIFWQSDFTPPDDAGYQLRLRTMADILPATGALPSDTACCLPNGTCQCVNMPAALCRGIGGTTPLGDGVPCSSGSATLCRGGHMVGDMDCDGSRNNFDIDVFILALLDPVVYSQLHPYCSYLNGDMNCDGYLNNFDIDVFVDCLLHGCP